MLQKGTGNEQGQSPTIALQAGEVQTPSSEKAECPSPGVWGRGGDYPVEVDQLEVGSDVEAREVNSDHDIGGEGGGNRNIYRRRKGKQTQ